MADGIALEGIRLIHDWLPRAVEDGGDLSARAFMLTAASMGAASFQKGLGAIHSLSHPLGVLYGVHHGLANAIVMPYVLKYNRAAVEERLGDLARYLDLPDHSFDGFQDWVLALRKQIGIPATLAEVGVAEAQLDRLAAMAFEDPNTEENPVPLDAEAFRELYLDAIHGRL
jgi:alcohol dehydrogenase class IV